MLVVLFLVQGAHISDRVLSFYQVARRDVDMSKVVVRNETNRYAGACLVNAYPSVLEGALTLNAYP